MERYADQFKGMKDLVETSVNAMEKLKGQTEKVKAENSELKKELEGQLDRIEELEARGSSIGKTRAFNQEQSAHTEAFINFIRRPNDHGAKAKLIEAEQKIRSAVTTTTPAGGGYAVPEEISQDIEARVRLLNPFRSLVAVRQASTSRYHELVSLSNDSFGWIGEGGTRTETTTPGLRDRVPTIGTAYELAKASEESMNDIFFDVRNWLVENASDSIASGEATAIVSGNGTNKPTGFLNTTPVTTVDDASPLRSADALQYVAGWTGTALTADKLIEMATSAIKERYLVGGPEVAWVMSRTALAQVRSLKDTSGRFCWNESLQPGVPSLLLGYPLYTSDAMPAATANLFPIAFGNWRRGYVLVDLAGGLRITVDDNITTPGQVRFYIRRRVGGIIRNNDALKVIKYATT